MKIATLIILSILHKSMPDLSVFVLKNFDILALRVQYVTGNVVNHFFVIHCFRHLGAYHIAVDNIKCMRVHCVQYWFPQSVSKLSTYVSIVVYYLRCKAWTRCSSYPCQKRISTILANFGVHIPAYPKLHFVSL